jgi:hypothetical protein
MPESSKVPLELWLLQLISLDDAIYRFGAEANPENPDPKLVDCSEAIEWSAARAGIRPKVPDGSQAQYNHALRWGCKLTVAQAIATRGAILVKGAPNGVHHIEVSLGDGSTFGAHSHHPGRTTYDVGRRIITPGYYDGGALFAGIDY